jgi:hypothetical protein
VTVSPDAIITLAAKKTGKADQTQQTPRKVIVAVIVSGNGGGCSIARSLRGSHGGEGDSGECCSRNHKDLAHFGISPC